MYVCRTRNGLNRLQHIQLPVMSIDLRLKIRFNGFLDDA